MYSVYFHIQHDELIMVRVPTAQAAIEQARAYMRCFAPLKYWQEDTFPGSAMTGAAFKDVQGFYLFDVNVYPKLPKPIT